MPDSQITDDDREDLTAFLDGEADSTTRNRVESKLDRNATMRAEADALKRTWELLDHLPRAEPDSSFTSRTLDRLAAVRPAAASTIALPTLRRQAPWLSAGAIVLALVIGWFAAGILSRARTAPTTRLDDPILVNELRMIENLPLYEAAETMEYLQALDQPERFGADAGGP